MGFTDNEFPAIGDMGLAMIENSEKISSDAVPFDYDSIIRPNSSSDDQQKIEEDPAILIIPTQSEAISEKMIDPVSSLTTKVVSLGALKSNHQIAKTDFVTMTINQPPVKPTVTGPIKRERTVDEEKRDILRRIEALININNSDQPCNFTMNNTINELTTEYLRLQRLVYNVASASNFSPIFSGFMGIIEKMISVVGFDVDGLTQHQLTHLDKYKALIDESEFEFSLAGDPSWSPFWRLVFFFCCNVGTFVLFKQLNMPEVLKITPTAATIKVPDTPRFSFVQKTSVGKSL
jgi:hypothetical protein